MRTHRLSLLLTIFALVFFATLGILRGSWNSVAGDEATYLAMASSLAFDGDLQFDQTDLARLEAGAGGGRDTLILQNTHRGMTFSKPILYPVVAAPFYRILGESGMVLMNLLVLGIALWLATGYLQRRTTLADALLIIATFTGVSVVFPYVGWKTFDLFQAALSLAGLVLCLGNLRSAVETNSGWPRRVVEHRVAPWLGALLLGSLVSIRYPNALLLLAVVVILLSERRVKRALSVTLAAAAALGLILALTSFTSGAVNPYRAERASFTPTAGDPLTLESGLESHIEFNKATSSLGVLPRVKPLVSLYSGLYFLVGRHTGLLFYFPAALLFVASTMRYRDRMGMILLLTVVVSVMFYLLWLPHNYFGGAGFLGNRYFLSIYPALLLAPSKLPSRRSLLIVWAIGVVVALSALTSVTKTRHLDAASQNHAYAGIFRFFPYESTASDLDGSRDRFWLAELTRFVDPFVVLKAKNFVLTTETPAAELEVAHLRTDRDAVMRFWISSEAEDLELIYTDRGGRHTVPLTGEGGIRQIVEFEPAASWRYHPLWFRNVWDHGLPYYVRTYRLQLHSPSGESARAAVRYLGYDLLPTYLFDSKVLQAELPEEAVAGSVSTLSLRVQNLSREDWASNSDLPVFLSYRISRAGTEKPEWKDGPRHRLGQSVPPRGVLNRELEIEWPSEPGVYRVWIDLILAEVAWFADETEAPIFEGEVRIVSP